MDQMDENILKIKRSLKEAEKLKAEEEQWEKELGQSIYDEVTEIYQLPVRFRERELFDGRVGIYMPEDFREVDEDIIKQFYFNGNPPKLLYCSEESKFSIGFNWTEHVIANEYVWDFMKAVKQVLEKNGPKTRIISTESVGGRRTSLCFC